jgi:hypothetical protein
LVRRRREPQVENVRASFGNNDRQLASPVDLARHEGRRFAIERRHRNGNRPQRQAERDLLAAETVQHDSRGDRHRGPRAGNGRNELGGVGRLGDDSVPRRADVGLRLGVRSVPQFEELFER